MSTGPQEMKASLKLDNHGHPVEGTYSLLWNGRDQWREEINLPGYSEIQVAGKDDVSVSEQQSTCPGRLIWSTTCSVTIRT